MSYGLEIFKSGDDSCVGSTSNVCVKDGVHLTAHTNAVSCINTGAGDWVAPFNTASCAFVGGTWSSPLVYSSNDVTWNYIGSYTTPANTSVVHTGIAVMPERIVSRLMINQLTGDDEGLAHTYSLVGENLTTTAPSATDTVETLFLIFGR